MTHITSLYFNLFRSYKELSLQSLSPAPVILHGSNGAGKTNILEAISLLSPGRGLRQAKILEMQNQKEITENGWTIAANVDTHFGPVRLGVGRDPETNKRLTRINGEPSRTQAALGEWLACIWLTPQMDRLFIDSAGSRRKFFDRLVYTFDPGHMGRLTRYENAMSQRLKLLKEGQTDDAWLTGLESQMAETGTAISVARRTFCEKLQQAYKHSTQTEQDYFPRANLSISGSFETLTKGQVALDTEQFFKSKLVDDRQLDTAAGTTQTGPHRSDFDVNYHDKSMPASQCSTGEQKALLIGIILAHARLLEKERNAAPILLLDEIVAHLDPNRRKVLAEVLASYSSQIWMTGTDPDLFSDFKENAQFFSVDASSVSASFVSA